MCVREVLMSRVILVSCLCILSLHADVWQKSQASEIDKSKHIEWQDTSSIETTDMKWEMAAKYCQGLHVGGNDDWRLPKKSELLGLAKDIAGKKEFKHLQNRVFWALEEDSEDDINAWAVYSGNGHLSSNDKCEDNAVICVRPHYEK